VSAASAFRRLVGEPRLTVVPVAATPLAARIGEQLGFEALGLGGYAMGANLALSEPLLSLEDVAACARAITRVCRVPLLVDAGAGWGEPLHTMHTVRTLEHAGAAAVHVEDQHFPKRAHYHQGIEHVVPADEMVAKLKAALAGRTDPDFVLVARTDAMATDSYDEGVRRAQIYHEAGADVVMCFPNNPAEAERAPRDLEGIPLIYVNSDGNRLGRGVYPTETLEDWGWSLVLDAITTTNVTAQAVHDALRRLKETGRTDLDQEKMQQTRRFVEDTIGLDEYYRLERETVEPEPLEGPD
jgi:2-methylisocitrate lyase-like PEP mutase family enzyme